MNPSERFGEVRSLLNRPDAWKQWALLCELLDGFDPGQLDQMVLPYIAAHVRRWPASACVAPRDWVVRALEGEDLPFWSICRSLNLANEYLQADQIEAFLLSPRMGSVEILNLESNRIGPQGARMIASSPGLSHVEELRVGFNALMWQGVRALGEATSLTSLRALDLEKNGLEDDGAVALAQCGFMASLERLVLTHNTVRDMGMTAVMRALRDAKKVRALRLDYNTLGLQSAALLGDGSFGALTELELRGCIFSDQVLGLLRGGGEWSALRVLDLGHNDKLSSGALRSMIAGSDLSSLEVLHLSRCIGGVDEALLQEIARAHLPKLRIIELRRTATGRGGSRACTALLERGVQLVF